MASVSASFGDHAGKPHPGFDSLVSAFAVFSRAAHATADFQRETVGHCETVTKTGPDGDEAARDVYKKTFGAL